MFVPPVIYVRQAQDSTDNDQCGKYNEELDVDRCMASKWSLERKLVVSEP